MTEELLKSFGSHTLASIHQNLKINGIARLLKSTSTTACTTHSPSVTLGFYELTGRYFHCSHQAGAVPGARTPPAPGCHGQRAPGPRAEALTHNEQHRGLNSVFLESPENAKLKGKREHIECKYSLGFFVCLLFSRKEGKAAPQFAKPRGPASGTRAAAKPKLTPQNGTVSGSVPISGNSGEKSPNKTPGFARSSKSRRRRITGRGNRAGQPGSARRPGPGTPAPRPRDPRPAPPP